MVAAPDMGKVPDDVSEKVMKHIFLKLRSVLCGAALSFQLRLLQMFWQRCRRWIPQEQQILKQALLADRYIERQMIPALAQPLFQGKHPKDAFQLPGEIFLHHLSPDDVLIAIGDNAVSLLQAFAPGIQKGYGLITRQEQEQLDVFAGRSQRLEFSIIDPNDFDFAQFKQHTHYTTALLMFMLEYQPDPVAFLRNVAADRLCVCVASQEHWLARLCKRLKLPDQSRGKRYSRRQLAAKLTEAGYVIRYLGFNAYGDIECCAVKPTGNPLTRPRICYAGMAPERFEIGSGGRVKLLYLSRMYPECFDDFDLLYLVSSALPANIEAWLAAAAAHQAKIVLNQDGVAYPAWAGEKHEVINRPLRMALNAADWVFYQSRFSHISADLFLQTRVNRYDILPNPVDTTLFFPPEQPRQTKQLTLLLSGNQYEYYRFETALRTLYLLQQTMPTVRLLITGQLNWLSDLNATKTIADKLIHELRLEEHIELVGSYTQRDAPAIYRSAHILLHPKYNDPCPTVVIEAMACGLPVVYSNSGGTPELVGQEAGIGVDAECNWDRIIMPSAHELALAATRIWNDYERYSAAARARAVAQFDLSRWIQQHDEIFKTMIHKK